jgi:RNase P/RNase MRP subunit POP5
MRHRPRPPLLRRSGGDGRGPVAVGGARVGPIRRNQARFLAGHVSSSGVSASSRGSLRTAVRRRLTRVLGWPPWLGRAGRRQGWR